MICEPCKKGADIITRWYGPNPRREATEKHAECKGCDCQHRVELQVEGRSVR